MGLREHCTRQHTGPGVPGALGQWAAPEDTKTMKPLSGPDGAFLHLEAPATPMHVGSLSLFGLPSGYRGDFYTRLKRQMTSGLRAAPVFQRKLAPMPLQLANPVWVHDDAVDLDHHVQRLTRPPPGTQAQLEDTVARLRSDLLDRSRPLWRLFVIDGLHSGQWTCYIKLRHAVLDGQAGVLLAQALFDVTKKPRAMPRLAADPGKHPGLAELAAAALKHDAVQYIKLLRHLPDVVRTLAGLFGPAGGGRARPVAGSPAGQGPLDQNFAFGPKTPLNVPITGQRGFAALSIPLRAAGNTDYTTQATMLLVNRHTDMANPVARLHAIRDAAGAVKALASRSKGILPTDYPTLFTPWLLHGLASEYGRSGVAAAIPPIANLVISNVPGSQMPLYAAGARMATDWPLSITEHGVGLNITVMSCAGAMGFGFTTARSEVPDPHELTHALAEALAELVAATPPAAPVKPRPTATRARKRQEAPHV